MLRDLFAPLVCLYWLALPTAVLAQTEQQLDVARQRMVSEEVEDAGITDQRVLAALRETPRHLFVSRHQRHLAYHDMALPIGEGQTISPPFIVAYMTQALEPRPTDRVLEIGTGSGYQAAVLSQLVDEVYSIEIVAPLGRKARRILRRLDYRNVYTKIGDGFQGWAEHAPFDSIIVTCNPEQVPPALIQQLREGGRLVVPLGKRFQQTLVRFRKANGRLEAEPLQPTFFVPMTGYAERLRTYGAESGRPRLQNASFEVTDDTEQLAGWYYVRQAEVVTSSDAIHGDRYLEFDNETAGRSAQALQAFAIDGRHVATIDLLLWIQTTNVRQGRSASELPHLHISFFDEKQVPCGSRSIGPWHGSIRWIRKVSEIEVPRQARLAVLAAGMFGATGHFSIDALQLELTQER